MGRYLWAEVLIFEVLYVLNLYPTHRHAYRAVVFAAMVNLAAQIYLTPDVTSPPVVTFHVGFLVAFRFTFRTYLLFAKGTFPDHWRRARDEVHATGDTGGSDRLPSNFPLTKKLWWMADIAYNPRMIGWVQESRIRIPPHPPPSRRTFLKETSLKLVINVFIVEFTNFALAMSPAFNSRLHDPTDGPETYLAAIPLLRRVPYVLTYVVGAGALMSAIHNVIALVCVGLAHSSPTLWPDIWGRWGDAYTMRRLWGYVH